MTNPVTTTYLACKSLH